MKAQLLVPAAGRGTRLGASGPKALVPLGGEPMLVRTLRRFDSLDLSPTVILVVSEDHRPAFERALDDANAAATPRFVTGGQERQDSVRLGLDALDADTEIVVIHDAARPFVSQEAVQASLEAAATHGASTVAAPCVDTILRADNDAFLVETPDRTRLWACQTPQTFQVGLIREAHRHARDTGLTVTDDATLVQRMGHPVKLVAGNRENLKVTTAEDVAYAEYLLARGETARPEPPA